MGVLLVNLKAKKMQSAISLGLYQGPGLCPQAQADRQTHTKVFGGKTGKLQQSKGASHLLTSTLEIISWGQHTGGVLGRKTLPKLAMWV